MRIERIEIKADAEGAAVGAGDGQRIGKHGGKPAPTDFCGPEYLHAESRQKANLLRFVAAHADHRHPCRIQHRACDAGHLRRADPEQGGQRHAVRVVRRAGFRGVRIEVGIDPDQAGRFAERRTDAAPRAGRNGMVAAQHHWYLAGGHRTAHLESEFSEQRRQRRQRRPRWRLDAGPPAAIQPGPANRCLDTHAPQAFRPLAGIRARRAQRTGYADEAQHRIECDNPAFG